MYNYAPIYLVLYQVRKQKKQDAINKKKAFIVEQQQQDLQSFEEKQTQILKVCILQRKHLLIDVQDQPNLTFQEILTKLAGKLSHTSIVPSSDLSCSLPWMELYIATLHHQERIKILTCPHEL